MLELSQFKQLKTLSDLKSRQSLKFVIIPENLKASISYKTLLSEATWSSIQEFVNVRHIFKDRSYYVSYLDEFSLIDLEEILNIAMIDYDDEEGEFIVTFENKKAFKDFLDEEDYRISNATYLELDNQMIEELAAKTREAQLDFYDRKIAKAELDIKLATKALKEFEKLKGELMNESK